MISKTSYKREKYSIEDFLEVMKILREPGGCPWDIEQTHKSIRRDLLEEAYETADAIDLDDSTALCEELGDLLLQVVFHADIARRNGEFTFDEVVDGITKKLILRHPHVFGDVEANTSAEVLDNWDKIKRVEKHQESYTDTLESVPRAFPALLRAAKVQKRAAKAGFDWDEMSGAFEKISEETAELKDAVQSGVQADINEEFGDLLFSMVNVSRFVGTDAEDSLAKATDKFIARFKLVEAECVKMGKDMKEMTLVELDDIWNRVKHN
ncbi:MAG: nucleoside triphosphate pyrophosphohydrolase [Ruminococcaceae bacterium]|nr:nucleoside triphosphate pyrophosphohydrolase [Oscillospiraceae bacterium]